MAVGGEEGGRSWAPESEKEAGSSRHTKEREKY